MEGDSMLLHDLYTICNCKITLQKAQNVVFFFFFVHANVITFNKYFDAVKLTNPFIFITINYCYSWHSLSHIGAVGGFVDNLKMVSTSKFSHFTYPRVTCSVSLIIVSDLIKGFRENVGLFLTYFSHFLVTRESYKNSFSTYLLTVDSYSCHFGTINK